MIFLLLASIALAGWPATNETVIGFVNHFPMVRHRDDQLGESGANVVIMRAPWALIEPKESEFRFDILDEQLELAEREDIRLVVLLEAGPAHAAHVPWLVEKLRSVGHLQVRRDGQSAQDPSPFSPLYREYLERYIRAVVTYCSGHRRANRVFGYHNGCEWWYPMDHSYGALTEDAFRDFLKRKYGSPEKLSAAWGASVTNWDDVHAPRLLWLGSNRTNQAVMVPASAHLDACYATTPDTHVAVTPGEKIAFTVHWQGEDIRSGGVVAEIAWLDGEHPQPIGIAQSPLATHGAPAVCEAVAPQGARRAWLLAKSVATGSVTFTRLTCVGANGQERGPNSGLDPALGGWQFIRWSAGEPDKVTHEWKRQGVASIRYDASLSLDSPCQWPLAAVADWTTFRAQAMGRFIDEMASFIRKADPTRPIVSYLTFAFANPFEWDYAQQMAIQLEHWAPAARHQQILGMQLSSGEGDPDSIACALDMVRKYGKPMWAIDLLDFTRGTALGREGLTSLSKTVFDHGGTGIQYYCWWGTAHYNYLELGLDNLRQMIDETRRHAEAVRSRPIQPRVALVMPRMPLYGALQEPPNNWADFMGWYKLLRHLKVPVNVYTLEELARADLFTHRVLIVPDSAYLDTAHVATLRRALQRGLYGIRSGRFALRDLTGRSFATSETLAFSLVFNEPVGARLLGETYRQPTPSDTPPRLVCRPGSPRWDSPEAKSAIEALRQAGVVR